MFSFSSSFVGIIIHVPRQRETVVNHVFGDFHTVASHKQAGSLRYGMASTSSPETFPSEYFT